MSRNFLTPINLNGLELQGAAIGNLSTTSINAISSGTGRIQYDSTLNVLKYRDNAGWQTISTGGGSFTLGNTSISLGSTTTTLTGLTSITSTTFVGLLTGNASTATTLATARLINSVSFNGSADITITAAAGTLTGSTLASGVTASSLTSVGTLSTLTMGGALLMGTNRITGLGDPVNSQDAATKAYVDNVAQGVNAHDAVRTIFTTTIAGTYAAGSTTANPPGDGGTGFGATITFSATGTTTNDTSVTLALYDRVLVTQGVTAASGASSITNGIYVVTTAGTTGVATILTRSLDYDNTTFGDIAAGDLIYVSAGTAYTGTQWIQTNKGTATTGSGSVTKYGVLIGTDAISFTQFSGASSTAAGAGLVQNGNAFDVGTASSSRIVVNADNIDLATVSQSNGTTSTSATTFVSAVSIDSYGRVTGQTTGTVPFTALGTSTSTATSTAASGTITSARRITGAGIGSGTSIVVNHGLGQWVHAQLFDSSGNLVEVDVLNASTNSGTTTFTFATSQTLTGYQYVIVG
jgi:hypothetical protein